MQNQGSLSMSKKSYGPWCWLVSLELVAWRMAESSLLLLFVGCLYDFLILNTVGNASMCRCYSCVSMIFWSLNWFMVNSGPDCPLSIINHSEASPIIVQVLLGRRLTTQPFLRFADRMFLAMLACNAGTWGYSQPQLVLAERWKFRTGATAPVEQCTSCSLCISRIALLKNYVHQ